MSQGRLGDASGGESDPRNRLAGKRGDIPDLESAFVKKGSEDAETPPIASKAWCCAGRRHVLRSYSCPRGGARRLGRASSLWSYSSGCRTGLDDFSEAAVRFLYAIEQRLVQLCPGAGSENSRTAIYGVVAPIGLCAELFLERASQELSNDDGMHCFNGHTSVDLYEIWIY